MYSVFLIGFTPSYSIYNSILRDTTMKEKTKPEGEKKRKEKKEIVPEELLSEEMIRWMTEGTNPNMVPRSDNG